MPTATMVANIAIVVKPSALTPISAPRIEFLNALCILFPLLNVLLASVYVLFASNVW